MQESNQNINSSINNDIDEKSISDIFFHYIKHWKIFLISVLCCLFLAIVYLKYTTSEYKIFSTIVIKDDKKGQAGYDMTAFSDLGILSQGGNIDNEIEILRSFTLMKSVVDSLGLNVNYNKSGWLKDKDIYKTSPIKVTVNKFIQSGSFVIDRTEKDALIITDENSDFTKNVYPNEIFESPSGWLTISIDSTGTEAFPININVLWPESLPYVNISSINKTSSVVELSMITSSPQKGIDIINTLVDTYNNQVIEDKNYVANKTISFINERLLDISGELKSAEKNVETYKQSKNLTDTQAESGLYLNASTEYEKKISDADAQIMILNFIRNYLKEPENKNSIVPANIGLTDLTIINLIRTYNDLLLEKERTTAGMKAGQPLLREYEERAASLRNNLLKGIDVTESGLKLTRSQLVKQESMYSGKIRNLSTQERETRELYRQKDIKETLYIYLLQKKEETGLSLSTATPNAKVIDRAMAGKFPVKPKGKIILLAAFILGIILPIIYIYLKELFNYKLGDKDELTRIVKAPFLGEIPISKDSSPLPVSKVRSGIAEKFRTIASNLNFVIGHSNNKVILVTSTISGEGKSFFSRNLALSLATSGKKTLLIDLDIRKSVMNQTLELTPSKGIVIFLSDIDTTIEEIVDKTGKIHKNLDIIPTKIFPPNPAELLASDRLDELFEKIAPMYDYIIVDTPPVGLVSDAYRLNQFANACIYVTRSEYTHKKSLFEIQDLYKDQKLNSMTCVLNGASKTNSYGYSYGNNYYHDDK